MMAIFISAVVVLILSASALYFSRHEPIRNGYQAQVRTRMKGGKVVILEPKDDPRIVGDDGPWRSRLQRPKTARIRDMSEPMGM